MFSLRGPGFFTRDPRALSFEVCTWGSRSPLDAELVEKIATQLTCKLHTGSLINAIRLKCIRIPPQNDKGWLVKVVNGVFLVYL